MNIKNIDSKLVRRLTLLTVLVLAIYYVEQKITVVFTESINATLLWRTAEAPTKGDYANYALPIVNEGQKYVMVTKRVRCIPGELLLTKNKEYYCNGERLGRSFEKTRDGKPLTGFEWNGEVPKDKVFLMGDHQRSFDSRYWGFATLSETEKAIKII